VKKVKR